MADTKISALPSASTPLTGTEVLPIVQGAANFKVSVADLTTGRALSATAITLTSGTANGVAYLNGSKVLTTGSALTFDGTNNIALGSGGTANAATSLTLDATDNAANGSYILGRRNGSSAWLIGDTASSLGSGTGFTSYNYGTAPWIWFLQTGGEQMRLTSSGLEVKQSQLIGYSSYAGIGTNGLAVAGNVGIGTSSPAYKLDVAGSLLGRGETNALGNTAVSATMVLRVGRGASGTENISAGAAGLDGILGYPTFKSTADGQNQRGVSGNVYSIADGTARVISSQSSLYAFAGGKGANVTITDAYGLYVEAPTAGATNTGIYNAGSLINMGNLGIGTTSPSASAILDAQSTTKGVRMPNMTTTQKNAIASPAAGLMVFDTTLAKLCVYSGAAWQTITSI